MGAGVPGRGAAIEPGRFDLALSFQFKLDLTPF